MNKVQPRKSPVGLETGDEYVTTFGNLEVLDKRGKHPDDEYLMKDLETGEETWMDFDLLVRIMQGNVFDYE